MSDEDTSLTEKRVYAGGDGAAVVYAASAAGLVRISVSDDIVGEFTLDRRGEATDVASADGRLAVATPEDVLVGADGGFERTEFGPATAVAYHEGLIASDGDRIARYNAGWKPLSTPGGVRAIDGGMTATESGIYTVEGTHVGLDDARDVSTAGTPLAATDGGLYYLANGWMRATDGAFRIVASDGDRAYAATGELLYERSESGEWTPVDLPVAGPVVDVVSGDGVYAITEDGVFLANAGDGWRHRSIGVTGVSALAIL